MVAVHCVPSRRNPPAQAFLSTIGEINKHNADTSIIGLTLGGATVVSMKYEAETIATNSPDSFARETDNATKANTVDRVAALNRIPLELSRLN